MIASNIGISVEARHCSRVQERKDQFYFSQHQSIKIFAFLFLAVVTQSFISVHVNTSKKYL